MNVTFITGNGHKARILEQYLDFPVNHKKVELDELQSLDLHKITEHKVRQAFELIKEPVLIEDVGVRFAAWGKLPGPLIRWFVDEMGLEKICRLLDTTETRTATAMITFAYYDGINIKFFDGEIIGEIAPEPRGKDFGWNPIFIPDGSELTYAQMDEQNKLAKGLRTSTVFPAIKEFLGDIDKA
jgi:non-canonical purine NTP pyrophosphatase (RdgB/HAM1 family)